MEKQGRGRMSLTFFLARMKRQKRAEAILNRAYPAWAKRDVPEYLEVDHRSMKGRFARAPKLSDVPYPVTMEPNLVVEFYSR